MFSHLTSRMKQNDPSHQRQMQQKQQQQAQKLSEDLNKRIMGIIQLKDLDNKLIR